MIFTLPAEGLVLRRQRFFWLHAVLPGLMLGLTFTALEQSGADVWLSAHFYDAVSAQWPYKDHWLIQKVLHKGGRLVFFSLAALMLGSLLWSCRKQSAWRNERRPLLYLFLATISGPLLILVLKNHTHIYCPWDLQLFGSQRPYIRFFDLLSPGLPVGHCFPAAHAGSGYAFVSLYFCLLYSHKRYRYQGLGFALLLGVLYGVTQQMRGAHFLSHDVMSLLICWYSSLLLFLVFFSKRIRWI